jgi:hypothetical protein
LVFTAAYYFRMLLKNQLPVDLNVSTQVLQKLSNLLSQLENTLEQKSCLFSDLIDKWSTSEEELFFEVINEDSVRKSLKK